MYFFTVKYHVGCIKKKKKKISTRNYLMDCRVFSFIIDFPYIYIYMINKNNTINFIKNLKRLRDARKKKKVNHSRMNVHSD